MEPASLTAVAGNPLGDALAVKVEKVAELLDCSNSQVYSLVKQGKLDEVRLSGGKKAGKRVVVASVFRFLETGGVAPADGPTPSERAANAQRRSGQLRRAA